MSEGQTPGIGRAARHLRDRVKSALSSSDETTESAEDWPSPSPASSPSSTKSAPAKDGPATSGAAESGSKKGMLAKVADQRKQYVAAQAELDRLTEERDELRQQRLALQQELGAVHGKSVLPRLKVEKTNGVPTFVVSQRMMQRIHGRAEDSAAGLDGIGTVFADAVETARYATSHGVPSLEGEGLSSQAEGGTEPTIIAHSFKGAVPLVEVHGSGGVRHFEINGTDPGDIRPAATYDAEIPEPTGLSDIGAWSKRLSRFIPRPYVQIHWTETAEGPRLHHVDVDPDRIPVLTPEWDKKLGLAFDGAYARFLKQPFRRGGLDNRVPGGTFVPEERA